MIDLDGIVGRWYGCIVVATTVSNGLDVMWVAIVKITGKFCWMQLRLETMKFFGMAGWLVVGRSGFCKVGIVQDDLLSFGIVARRDGVEPVDLCGDENNTTIKFCWRKKEECKKEEALIPRRQCD